MIKVLLIFFMIIILSVNISKAINTINIGTYFFKKVDGLYMPLQNVERENNYKSKDIQVNITTGIIPMDDPFTSSKAFCSMIEKTSNLVAVFASESSWASPIVQSITSKLNLPYIQTNWRQSNSYIGGSTALNFYPDFDLLSQGLAKLVESLQWKSFVVLYEDFDGFMRIQDILKLQKYQDKNRNNMIVLRLNFDKDIRALLKQIKRSGEHRIILDCEAGRIMQFLEQAKSVGIMSFVYNYFLTSLDAHTINPEDLKVDANITTVRIINPENEDFQDIVRSWEFNENLNHSLIKLTPYGVKTETMLIHEAINLLMGAVHDIYRDKNIKFSNVSCNNEEKFEHGPDIISYMNSHYMRTGSVDNLSFTDTGKRKNFTLYLIEGNRNETIATWNAINPGVVNVIRTREEITKKRQETLQDGTKIIASRLEAPYLIQKKNYKNFTGNDRYEGYVMDLVSHISGILHNFSFEFQIVADQKNGEYNQQTHNWDGIIGEIVNEKALFGVSDMTITAERETAVDFSMPYKRLGIGILLQKPNTFVDMFAFLKPLDWVVWMYTVTIFLAVTLLFYFVARMAPDDWQNPHPCNFTPDEMENIWSFSNCLWYTMGSIMNQGCDILPNGMSTQLVATAWSFFALIMTNSYTASLAAFLTAKGAVIANLEDLAKQNKIKYGTLEGGSTQAFFKQSNYSIYRRMYANMRLSKPTVFVKTIEEGVKKVKTTKDGLYAFLMESSTIDYLTERNCSLTTLENKYFNHIEYGIAMPLDCPYRSDINDAILQLQEQGTLTNLTNKWWKNQNTGESCPALHRGAELKLINVGGLFIVLGIGIGVALLIGVFEFLWTVRCISIEEHISYWEAFKIELMLSLKLWVKQKKAKPQSQIANN